MANEEIVRKIAENIEHDRVWDQVVDPSPAVDEGAMPPAVEQERRRDERKNIAQNAMADYILSDISTNPEDARMIKRDYELLRENERKLRYFAKKQKELEKDMVQTPGQINDALSNKIKDAAKPADDELEHLLAELKADLNIDGEHKYMNFAYLILVVYGRRHRRQASKIRQVTPVVRSMHKRLQKSNDDSSPNAIKYNSLKTFADRCYGVEKLPHNEDEY